MSSEDTYIRETSQYQIEVQKVKKDGIERDETEEEFVKRVMMKVFGEINCMLYLWQDEKKRGDKTEKICIQDDDKEFIKCKYN